MRGIKLSHGTIFIEHRGITVKITQDGQCEISPIMLDVLEWDLRTEPPSSWDHIYESEIRSLDGGVFDKAMAVVDKALGLLGE